MCNEIKLTKLSSIIIKQFVRSQKNNDGGNKS